MSIKIIGKDLPNMPWEDRKGPSDGLPVWRYSANPIIGWNPTPSTARIFNSAVLPYKDGFVGVFRADSKHINPSLHVGYSKDAIHWEFEDTPISWVDEDGNPYNHEIHSYDPRLIELEGKYYIIWCVDFAGCPTIGLGYTEDFESFHQLNNPFLTYNRNGVLFPRKINGKYAMLSRPTSPGSDNLGSIWYSESPDLEYWGHHHYVMSPTNLGWQSMKMGPGPAPIETDEGWLLIYHGVKGSCAGLIYAMGCAILDINEPWKVLYRTKKFIMNPWESYECVGDVHSVVFPCATLCDADTGRLAIYYGAADTSVGLAFTTVDDLIRYTKENSL